MNYYQACPDSGRRRLWPYLCARRLVGHRGIDLEHSPSDVLRSECWVPVSRCPAAYQADGLETFAALSLDSSAAVSMIKSIRRSSLSCKSGMLTLSVTR